MSVAYFFSQGCLFPAVWVWLVGVRRVVQGGVVSGRAVTVSLGSILVIEFFSRLSPRHATLHHVWMDCRQLNEYAGCWDIQE